MSDIVPGPKISHSALSSKATLGGLSFLNKLGTQRFQMCVNAMSDYRPRFQIEIASPGDIASAKPPV